jgi:AcrR family transcriptional regulator
MELPTGIELMVAARELYAAEGAEGLSMRKLARRVGLAHSSIYKHFRPRAAVGLHGRCS